MGENNAVLYSVEGGIATIELNRPETGNAMEFELAKAFADAAQMAAADPEVAVIQLRAAGRNFCVGGNLGAISIARPEQLHDSVQHMARGIAALHEAPKPVIVAVQGAVAGGGLGIALTADLVVIESATRFIFAYPDVGLTPDCGVSWLLPRVVGVRKALSMALTGETVDAEEAVRIGLATTVVDVGETAAAAEVLAERLVSGAAEAFGGCRRLLWDAPQNTLAESLKREEELFVRATQSDEAQTRMAAFLAR